MCATIFIFNIIFFYNIIIIQLVIRMESAEQHIEKLLNQIEAKNKPQQVLDCLTILEKLIQNLLTNPLEHKFRTIKTTNNTIKTKVLGVDGIIKLLESLGYVFEGECYVLNDESLSLLLEGFTFVDWRKRLIQAKLTSPEAYKVALQVVKNQRQIQNAKKKQMRQEQRLKKMAQNDKKERKHMKADTSKSNQLGFGVNQKTWKDLGVDLCKKNQG